MILSSESSLVVFTLEIFSSFLLLSQRFGRCDLWPSSGACRSGQPSGKYLTGPFNTETEITNTTSTNLRTIALIHKGIVLWENHVCITWSVKTTLTASVTATPACQA